MNNTQEFHLQTAKRFLLNIVQIDGEGTQNLLKLIGMEEQMLRQLVMTADLNKVTELLEERVGLVINSNVDKFTLARRRINQRLSDENCKLKCNNFNGNLYIGIEGGEGFKLDETEVDYQAIEYLQDLINQIKHG
jgi:hypothetical protein